MKNQALENETLQTGYAPDEYDHPLNDTLFYLRSECGNWIVFNSEGSLRWGFDPEEEGFDMDVNISSEMEDIAPFGYLVPDGDLQPLLNLDISGEIWDIIEPKYPKIENENLKYSWRLVYEADEYCRSGGGYTWECY